MEQKRESINKLTYEWKLYKLPSQQLQSSGEKINSAGLVEGPYGQN